jgi:hypothetical protein
LLSFPASLSDDIKADLDFGTIEQLDTHNPCIYINLECTVRIFRQKFTPEDAIRSRFTPLEALPCM